MPQIFGASSSAATPRSSNQQVGGFSRPASETVPAPADDQRAERPGQLKIGSPQLAMMSMLMDPLSN
jgi:hypothetical protein